MQLSLPVLDPLEGGQMQADNLDPMLIGVQPAPI
jgi:hypothetical protein